MNHAAVAAALVLGGPRLFLEDEDARPGAGEMQRGARADRAGTYNDDVESH